MPHLAKWLSLTLCLLLGYVVAHATPPSLEASPEPTLEPPTAAQPVRHVLLLKFQSTVTAEIITELEQAFAALPRQIEEIVHVEWGTNTSPAELAGGYTHCFVVTAQSTQDRDAFLRHAAHQQFAKLIRPYVEEALVIDYSPETISIPTPEAAPLPTPTETPPAQS